MSATKPILGDVLVVGARPGSLGAAVAEAVRVAGGGALTAGLNDEDYSCDVFLDTMSHLRSLIERSRPQHVVCTVGLNMPESQFTEHDPKDWYRWHFETNVVGPLRLLRAFSEWVSEKAPYTGDFFRHYVAISSNSATLPRSSSAAYCASKAALSQALRVKAREAQGGDAGYLVYAYEPGLLEGTPMTQKTADDFPGMPLHRMRGLALERGVSAASLAAQIVAGLQVPGAALNGALIRYDGGEL